MPILRLFRRRPKPAEAPVPPAEVTQAAAAPPPAWPAWLDAWPSWVALATGEGTATPPQILIEAQDFFLRGDEIAGCEASLADAGRAARVAFVPPGFLPRAADGAPDREASRAAWQARHTRRDAPAGAAETGLTIICLANAAASQRLGAALAAPLEAEFGTKVRFVSACLPPFPVVLSDLVYLDWFARAEQAAALAPVSAALAPLRGASVILADISQAWRGTARAVLPVLSHDFRRDPAADRLVLRDQAYTKGHAALDVGLIPGAALSPASQVQALRDLGQYLGVPVFGILPDPALAPLCPMADFVLTPGPAGLAALRDALLARLRETPPRAMALPAMAEATETGPGGFGAVLAREETLAGLLAAFAGLALVGPEASLPWLRHAAASMGKPCVAAARFDAPELAGLPADSCVVGCGAMGAAPEGRPLVAFMPTGQGGLARLLGAAAASLGAPPTWFDQPGEAPAWYYREAPVPWSESELATLAAAAPGLRGRA